MGLKWLGDSTSNNRDKIGSVLVARYVVSGNTEYHIESVDWATAIITFKQPHGLPIGTLFQPLITPNYVGLDNPTRDVRSIPMEWIKPQGVAGNTNPNNITTCLLPDTATTAKVVRSTDSAALPVNLTSIENTGNVDITKFHFEKCIPWAIDNLPLLKKFRIHHNGYWKNHLQYRYTDLQYKAKDGSTGNVPPYHQLLGINMNGNPYVSTAIYITGDITMDFTSQQAVQQTYNTHRGRRAAFTSLVWDQVIETDIKVVNVAKEIEGVTRISMNAIYAYLGNGSVIEIYDEGGYA